MLFTMGEFEAIKQDGSDVLFSMSQFHPPLAPVYDKIGAESLTGAEIIQHVLNSPRIKNAATEIAHKQDKTIDVVLKEVHKMLEDIGHTFNLKGVRFTGYFLRKVFRNIYEGIKVNLTGLEKVKELTKEVPVILVPSHRSYTDFLLVSFVCFIFQLPLPVIAAAQDFKNMTLIGGLLRNCGAFYMKRSFRSDELYWIVFYEYVQCLVLNSGTTMEFFLEGTRSRSGKSLHPKQGLLSIVTDLYFTSRVPDIIFCPISITYDRVLEEKLLARELLGIPKPRESFTGLLNSRFVLTENYGYAYLHFGKPISFREFSEGKLNREARACIPRSIRNDPSQDEMVVVRELASHILNKIQDHLIILPNMVVASILLHNPRGMNLEMLINEYNIIRGWCKTCSIPIVGKDGQDSRGAVMESIQLLKSSLTLAEDNSVCLLDPEQFPKQFKNKVYALLKTTYLQGWELKKFGTNSAEHLSKADNSVDEKHSSYHDKENGNSREDKLTECDTQLTTHEKMFLIHLTCIHLQLAHQRNQLLHWFYVPAMALLAGNRKKQIPEDKLYAESKFLGDILSVEVAKNTFPSKEVFLSELENFKALGIFVNNNGFYEIQETKAVCFISDLWSPLLTSYWVVYSYILECCTEGTEYIPEKLIHGCQEFALSLFLKGIVTYLEIQSLELLRNGLNSLQKCNIVKQLNHGSGKRIVILNKKELYNLAVNLGSVLQLSYVHATSLSSKL